MAYPTICTPCLDGRHGQCEVSLSHKKPEKDVGYAGWFCVCAHGGEESKFQRSVRERMEEERKGRDHWAYGSGPGTLAGDDDL